MNWNLTDKRQQSITPLANKLKLMDPNLPLEQMTRLLGMAKAKLPAMSTRHATILVSALGGLNLPYADANVDWAHLIASEVDASLPEEPETESLRREFEESAEDPEWVSHYLQMPDVKFAHSLRALDPLQAYLLIVTVECFWSHRKHDPESKPPLVEFFNIRDEPPSE